MDEQLKVSISGDSSGLEAASKKAAESLTSIGTAGKNANVVLSKTLGDLQSQLKRFQDGLKNAGSTESFSRIQRAIDATKQRIDLLGKINSFQSVTKGSEQATQAIINLSRVAQDAPYGFIGIANNINPLLESFQRLQKETGSTKASFGALLSGLTGAGGIGLAVGVVSSLLVVLSGHMGGASQKADELAKAFDHVADSSKDAVEQVGNLQSILSSVSGLQDISFKIQGKGQAQFLKEELNSIKTLRDVATAGYEAQAKRDLYNETNYFNQSDDIRQKIDEQIRQHNDNVKKLDAERISWNEKVRLQELKIKLQEKQDAEDAAKKADEAAKKANEDSKKRQKEAADNLKEYFEERRSIIAEFLKDFAEIKIFTLPDVGDPKDNKELFNRLRKKIVDDADQLLPVKIKLPVTVEIVQDVKTGKITIKEQLEEIGSGLDPVKLSRPLKIQTSIQVDIDSIAINKKLEEQLLRYPAKLRDQIRANVLTATDALKETLSNVMTDSFASLGEAAAAAITGGDLGNAFESLFSLIGGSLAALGKQMIALSPIIAALKAAIKTLNPAILLPAGIALVAIGSVLRNLRPKGFAKGGFVPGQGSGDTVPAMLTPGEFVVTKDKANLVASILKAIGTGIKMPRISNNIQHFADGGFVSNKTALSTVSNNVTNNINDFPQYLPAFEMTHDRFRLWYSRADKYGNTFGR